MNGRGAESYGTPDTGLSPLGGIVGRAQAGDMSTTRRTTTGEILLITGVGGSLGTVIEATGLDSGSATSSRPTRAHRWC